MNIRESTASLSEVAYDYVLALLRNGQVGQRDRLVEAELAANLGVSRVPVRQALLQLVAEGYLFSTARGYRIPVLTHQDIEDVFELRLLLEPRAAALAARDISSEQVMLLDGAIEEAIVGHQSGEVGRVFRAGLRFRAGWLDAVKNSRLVATVTRYADQVTAVRRATMDDFHRQEFVIAGYQELRDLFAKHDSVGAQDATVRFILAAQRDFSRTVSSG